jgi:phosphoglycerol transferase MdoB-like AlkP superfamily enzyme
MERRTVLDIFAGLALALLALAALQIDLSRMSGLASGPFPASLIWVPINLLLLASPILLARALLPWRTVSALVVAIVACFLAVQSRKHHFLKVPLFPSDLVQLKQLRLLSSFVTTTELALALLGLALLVIVAVAPIFRQTRMPGTDSRPRVALALASLPGLALLVALLAFPQPLPFEVRRNPWQNRRNIGVPAALTLDARRDFAPPPGYRRELAEVARRRQAERTLPPPARGREAWPDLVLVLVESWFDPAVLPALQTTRDAMAELRPWMAKGGGEALVSMFAGGTSNIEYEVLTGVPMVVLPGGRNAYEDYVRGPMPSIVRELNGRAYQSYAVHNFEREYWSRDRVLPWLGFRRYIAIDELDATPGPDWRPDDRLVTDKVIALLSERPAERPARFVHAITVGMHGDYDHPPLRQDPIGAAAPWARAQHRRMLGNYLTALERTSRELARLARWVRERERPTLMFAYGDHLPPLGDLYAAAGLRMEGPGVEKLLTTPTLTVANFKLVSPMPRRLTTFCVGSAALSAAGFRVHDPFLRESADRCARRPDQRGDELLGDPEAGTFLALAYERALAESP